MKYAYWVYFKVQTACGSSEHTRIAIADEPLEYGSDIVMLQDWAAKEVGAESAMIVSWTLLPGGGGQRPDTSTTVTA